MLQSDSYQQRNECANSYSSVRILRYIKMQQSFPFTNNFLQPHKFENLYQVRLSRSPCSGSKNVHMLQLDSYQQRNDCAISYSKVRILHYIKLQQSFPFTNNFSLSHKFVNLDQVRLNRSPCIGSKNVHILQLDSYQQRMSVHFRIVGLEYCII